MSIFKNVEKENAKNRQEAEAMLLPGEELIDVYSAVFDYVALTSHRVLFLNDGFTSKKKTWTSVPYGKITAVGFQKGKSFLSFSKTVVIAVSSADYEMSLLDEENARELHQAILNRVLGLDAFL